MSNQYARRSDPANEGMLWQATRMAVAQQYPNALRDSVLNRMPRCSSAAALVTGREARGRPKPTPSGVNPFRRSSALVGYYKITVTTCKTPSLAREGSKSLRMTHDVGRVAEISVCVHPDRQHEGIFTDSLLVIADVLGRRGVEWLLAKIRADNEHALAAIAKQPSFQEHDIDHGLASPSGSLEMPAHWFWRRS